MTTNPGFKVTVYILTSRISRKRCVLRIKLQRSPKPLAGLRGSLRGRDGKWERIGRVKGWEGRGNEGRNRKGKEGGGKGKGDRRNGRDGMGKEGIGKRERGEKGRKKATAPKLKFLAPPLFRLVLVLGFGSVLGYLQHNYFINFLSLLLFAADIW